MKNDNNFAFANGRTSKKKTSEHICRHLRAQARRERAYARGADKPKGER